MPKVQSSGNLVFSIGDELSIKENILRKVAIDVRIVV